MNLKSWSRAQIAGVLFIAVGLMNLLTADLLLGAVWALLGISMIAYVSQGTGRGGRRFEPSPRNLVALAAVVIALALLALGFSGVLG